MPYIDRQQPHLTGLGTWNDFPRSGLCSHPQSLLLGLSFHSDRPWIGWCSLDYPTVFYLAVQHQRVHPQPASLSPSRWLNTVCSNALRFPENQDLWLALDWHAIPHDSDSTSQHTMPHQYIRLWITLQSNLLLIDVCAHRNPRSIGRNRTRGPIAHIESNNGSNKLIPNWFESYVASS